MAGSKRRARAVALHALYDVLIQDESVDDAIESAMKMQNATESDAEMARKLVEELMSRQPITMPKSATEAEPEEEPERLARAFIRHVGRIVALQALYETDSVEHRPLDILEHLNEGDRIPAEAVDFSRSLVNGVLLHKQDIDAVLAKAAPAWPIEQIAVVDRNILRLAIYEILLDNKTPVRAAINEAVELAKSFGSDNSAKFVNGVLGSVSLSAAGHA